MRRVLSTLLLFLFLVVGLPRVGSAGPSRVGSGRGYAETVVHVFASKTRDDEHRGSLWSTILLEEKVRHGGVVLAGSIRFENVSSGETGPLELDWADREFRRAPFSVRELYLRLTVASGIDLEVGRFAIGWGRTDGYSPGDAFLPRDLSDPFADERLPLVGARLRGERRRVRFELLGTATTTPWRLPLLDGRYAPVAVSGVVLTDGVGKPPSSGFGAARVSRKDSVNFFPDL